MRMLCVLGLSLIALSVFATPTNRTVLRGVVEAGASQHALPISNAKVYLLSTDGRKQTLLGKSISDKQGHFSIAFNVIPAHPPKPVFYVVARKNYRIRLVSLLGTNVPPSITLNELTTVAAAYTGGKLFKKGKLVGTPLSLNIAAQMQDNIVNVKTGQLSSVMNQSPNADQTNARRLVNSLANVLSVCTRNNKYRCEQLFMLTDARPQNTFAAARAIAHNPTRSVAKIYQLSQQEKHFLPRLRQAPSAWTLALKFNQTGNEKTCPFGGPGGIVIDQKGYLWMTNNVVQGTPNSIRCLIVLQPNGHPAQGIHGRPISPVFGGGLLGGGFGITEALDHTIWQGNFGWGSCAHCLPNGSASQFTLSGHALSGPKGYQSPNAKTALDRVQGIVADQHNNIWMASFANNRVVVFLHGNPKKALAIQEPSGSRPFAIAISPGNDAWVTNTGSKQEGVPASVTIYRVVNNNIVKLKNIPVGSLLKAIVFDKQGNAWVASMGDSTIYQLNPAGKVINQFTGGGVHGPWGLAFDGANNLWVANFQPEKNKKAKFGVSGFHVPSGVAISPPGGFTLPSAGQPVLLGNGQPLRGPDGKPSFNPLMRQTFVAVDRAGNVWVTNNWKPFPLNRSGLNPGGDGVVVFLGLAAPSK